MFTKVLIANRGAIACRIIRTLKKMGVASVAVYSEADVAARHVSLADEALCLGPSSAAQSYLSAEKILAAAKQTGAQAIHPGYGFLSENADFAAACASAGIVFIGPLPSQMRAFGLKHTARELARANEVPLLPGSGLLIDDSHAQAEANRIGYPIMLKSTAGGGGIGMRLCQNVGELQEAFASVRRSASANFKDAGIYLEKYVEQARHVEVQIFGDGKGHVIALGERDCSMQRRNQKVIEETPAPGLSDDQRERLHATAVRLANAVGYQSAGTVEFVYDVAGAEFYFLEVNTRLQVEHGVTEAVTGVDLVEWMVRQAAGELSLAGVAVAARGASIQTRLYAENPAKNFQPSAGTVTEATFPDDVRVDTWIECGTEIPPYYDPLLAKVIVHAATRADAIVGIEQALVRTRICGIETNVDYLRQVLADGVFREGRQTTGYLSTFRYRPTTIDVLEAGVQTTVQDWPGRLGYWQIGVPPSGPMDAFAFRLANRLLDNSPDSPGLEMTVCGPMLKFNVDASIVFAGADMQAELDGEPVENWRTHLVTAGATLRFRGLRGSGMRTYLAVAGGFDVPRYLGSGSTFTLGQFGGHAGRPLRVGDVLHLRPTSSVRQAALHPALIPTYRPHWEIGVLYGPHGAPDFFTDRDIETFFATNWEVHYNSSRTGIRLIGPKPQWARSDGGEAGLHPSNIHDNAYAIGAIDFTGDMPVILGPDGPSLGGFVCPAVVVKAELWKLGQLKPGDTVRFRSITTDEAALLARTLERQVETLEETPSPMRFPHAPLPPAVIERLVPLSGVEVTYRRSGDEYLLIEYGPLVLDLNLRLRVHALMQALDTLRMPGIVELTPGVRSLQVHYDSRALPASRLQRTLVELEGRLPAVVDMEVASRVLHLPLAWNDSQTRLAIEKYTQSVRGDAPWCPSNIEFIRRINGLDSTEQVQEIVFGASYLVLGLGDVYLGAPVATPIDPRHRLVTTKYNPARTWTPENAVGIGGAYLCVYGMEGPGGYQFVGRTLQMWNRYRTTAEFHPGKPWLLRCFDQIRFFPVTEDELLQIRVDFPLGRYRLRVEEQAFHLGDYNRFLQASAKDIAEFKNRQQLAFEAERERWASSDSAANRGETCAATLPSQSEAALPPGARPVLAQVAGSLWRLAVREGETVKAGARLAVIESMKMEIDVVAPCDGYVYQVLCREGTPVSVAQNLVVLVLADSG